MLLRAFHPCPLPSLLAGCLLLLLAGCQVFSPLFPAAAEDRAAEKTAVFSALPEETQQRLRQGIIPRGVSPDMGFIAWGKPGSTFRLTDDQGGAREVWVYLESGGGTRSSRRRHSSSPHETYQQAAFVDGQVAEITLRSNRPTRPPRRH